VTREQHTPLEALLIAGSGSRPLQTRPSPSVRTPSGKLAVFQRTGELQRRRNVRAQPGLQIVSVMFYCLRDGLTSPGVSKDFGSERCATALPTPRASTTARQAPRITPVFTNFRTLRRIVVSGIRVHP